MYRATWYGRNAQTKTFFDSTAQDDSFTLISAELEIIAGSAGSFTFTLPPTNIAYKQMRRLTDFIDVYRDDDLIFSCRVYSIEDLFNTSQRVVCEGLLAILNDSIFRPRIFDMTVNPDLVSDIIDSHNEQMEIFNTKKKIYLGRTTPADHEFIIREFKTYETSLSRLKELADEYGGYFFLRKNYPVNEHLKLDWLDEFATTCTQSIDFGSNILDITKEINSDGICTYLIPLGAEDENGIRLTVESINDYDYITADTSELRKYSDIVDVHIWPDVTDPAELLSKGQAYLEERLEENIIINVSAINLADAGFEVENFKVGQKVYVTSNPHDIHEELLQITEQHLNLLNPASNSLILTKGKKRSGYVESQQQTEHGIIQSLKEPVSPNDGISVIATAKSIKGINTNLEIESQLNYSGLVCADTEPDPKEWRAWFGISENNGEKYGVATLKDDEGNTTIKLNGKTGEITGKLSSSMFRTKLFDVYSGSLAGDAYSQSAVEYTVDDGYYPLGVVGYEVVNNNGGNEYARYMNIYRLTLAWSSDTPYIYYSICNTGDNTRNVKLMARVLEIKVPAES